MDSPAEYMDSPMDGDDVAYPCKGCGEILEEGKAFELAGNRWHLNCFRCNTCGTLLDSDANLLLLGDGSLICNNCTYSCSACGNKIEDLAILTGDQAFCAACFRCRNCKRKIENLRYARTSQGIFCMSCHESLMARRRKKTRAAQNAKKKEDQSPMLIEKSLPALPPGDAPQRRAFTPENGHPLGQDNATPTELSPPPRPRQPYQNESSSRSSSRPRDRDRDRSPAGRTSNEGPNLTLPTTTYRNNRHSVISHASDLNSGDSESFFIPLALDPSPLPPNGSRGPSDSWVDPSKKNKENQGPDRDHLSLKLKTPNDSRRGSGASPHIAFQEKGRQPAIELDATPKETVRKAPARGRTAVKQDSPSVDDSRVQHAESPSSTNNIKSQTSGEKFKLGDVPKGKRSAKTESQSEGGTSGENTSRGSPVGISPFPYRKEPPLGAPRPDAPRKPERSVTPQPSQDRKPSEEEARKSAESNDSAPPARPDPASGSKSIPRKEISTGVAMNNISSMSSSSSSGTSPSSASLSDAPGAAPTLHGKPISAPLNTLPLADDLASRAPTRPPAPQQQNSTTYMAPRAAPPAPAAPPALLSALQAKEAQGSANGTPISPVLPRWSAGGDFTMDEDMARILGGADETSQSILRRVSNAVRHGRTGSEASIAARNAGHTRSVSETTTRTAQSPRWPRTPVRESANVDTRDISSPISIAQSPATATDDPALLRRQLRNSEQRVAELERQFTNEKDLQTLNKKLLEKRKTVSVLDSQTEIMIRQLEVLAGYVERAKDSKQPLNIAELEESAIKDFVQKLERLKLTMAGAIETLYEERNELLEEKEQIIADRDRALVEFEQLSSKNAQLADMNNDLTHQIQERFKAQSGPNVDAPRAPMNVLGIYTSHHKEKSSASLHLDDASLRPSTSTTMLGSVGSYQQSTDDSNTEPAVLAAPHVVNIRKGQAKKFNWKKGGQTVAKGVSKGFKGAFSSTERERNPQYPGQSGESIGLPYNMTMPAVEAPVPVPPPQRNANNDPARQGFGLFAKKGNPMPKSFSNGNIAAAEAPSTLFGSDLVERADYERRQIPSVVTRCIEEVELRGMDIEGIYRKTGGSGQVKLVQEGFDKTEDFDISDPSIDITAVTSVLKQYFRKLPVPLLTFDVYDRVLESLSITDDQDRCSHLRRTFNTLPPKHRDCLEFLIFHLARVAARESENLMSPKNLAVVFAPTIMRDHSLEREMTDMHSKNSAVQFVIENTHDIFGPA